MRRMGGFQPTQKAENLVLPGSKKKDRWSLNERLEQLRSYRQELYYDLENFKECSEHIWGLIREVERVIGWVLLYPKASICVTEGIEELFKSNNEAKQPLTSAHSQFKFTSATTWDELIDEIRESNK